jgi:hypothetical protein
LGTFSSYVHYWECQQDNTIVQVLKIKFALIFVFPSNAYCFVENCKNNQVRNSEEMNENCDLGSGKGIHKVDNRI